MCKKITAILLTACLIGAVLASCGGKNEDQTAKELQAYIDTVLDGQIPAVYTNRNGDENEVIVYNAGLSGIRLEKTKSGYRGKAKLRNDDWAGDYAFLLEYEKDAIRLLSPDGAPPQVSPAVPLDFSDTEVYKLFAFHSENFLYDEGDEVESAEVTEETIQKVEEVRYFPNKGLTEEEQEDLAFENYEIKVHLKDGKVLQGTISFKYWPAIMDGEATEMQGIEKWEAIVGDDFRNVGETG